MKSMILSIVAVCMFSAVQAGEYTRTYQRQGHVRSVTIRHESQPTPRHRCRCGKNCKCPNCTCRTK